jgi:hypothetical protein
LFYFTWQMKLVYSSLQRIVLFYLAGWRWGDTVMVRSEVGPKPKIRWLECISLLL